MQCCGIAIVRVQARNGIAVFRPAVIDRVLIEGHEMSGTLKVVGVRPAQTGDKEATCQAGQCPAAACFVFITV